MNYYSKETTIILKEYGTLAQNMVYKLIEEPDREKRTLKANVIIDIMAQLTPHVKSTENYKQKLWDHLFFMSDFKLDVDSPFPMVQRELIVPIPEKFDYPELVNKHRHYGKYIVDFIEKAIEMPEEKRDIVSHHIASYMKLVHKTWNNEVVNDAIVKNDLSKISNGQLEMPEDENIKTLMNIPKVNKFTRNKSKNKSNHKNKNNQNNLRNKNRIK